MASQTIIEGFATPSKKSSSQLSSGKILDVITVAFADKISVMVYSNGRIGKMVSIQFKSFSFISLNYYCYLFILFYFFTFILGSNLIKNI